LIRSSDVAAGCQTARQVLEVLPPEHRAEIFIRRGRDVLHAVPNAARQGQAVREYQEALELLG
jgi:hypothetical protein